jgi:hypothetical protein
MFNNTYEQSLVQELLTIPYEDNDPILHTEGHPFCSDPECPCRKDVDNIELLVDLVKMGLLTAYEANQVMLGATI